MSGYPRSRNGCGHYNRIVKGKVGDTLKFYVHLIQVSFTVSMKITQQGRIKESLAC